MKKLIAVLIVTVSLLSLAACDSRGYGNYYVMCQYSGEKIQVPLKGNHSVNGGYSTGFYSKKSMEQMKKIIEGSKEKDTQFSTEIFMEGKYLLVTKTKNSFAHYALLIKKQKVAQGKKDNYYFNNMRGYIGDNLSTPFLIPYHLIDDERVVNSLDNYFFGVDGSVFNKTDYYSITSDLQGIFQFYELTNAFDLAKTDTSIEITPKDTLSPQKPFGLNEKTVVIDFQSTITGIAMSISYHE